VDERKPLARGHTELLSQLASGQDDAAGAALHRHQDGAGHGQGLTLVHCSAQREPVLTQKQTLDTP